MLRVGYERRDKPAPDPKHELSSVRDDSSGCGRNQDRAIKNVNSHETKNNSFTAVISKVEPSDTPEAGGRSQFWPRP